MVLYFPISLWHWLNRQLQHAQCAKANSPRSTSKVVRLLLNPRGSLLMRRAISYETLRLESSLLDAAVFHDRLIFPVCCGFPLFWERASVYNVVRPMTRLIYNQVCEDWGHDFQAFTPQRWMFCIKTLGELECARYLGSLLLFWAIPRYSRIWPLRYIF